MTTPGSPAAARKQVVLVGNPNVGKTTLFNALTGSSAKVSNYPGITVDRRSGLMTAGDGVIELHDVPGTYSLNARSADEQIAFDAIVGVNGAPVPDVVVVCLDATQLARSAYLLLQCQELGARCVVALTMVDEAAIVPDAAAVAAAFQCEVVPVTARTRLGLAELRAAIERTLATERTAIWRWSPAAHQRANLDAARAAIPDAWRAPQRYAAPLPAADDALALWALTCVEDDDELELPASLRVLVRARTVTAADDDDAVLGRWNFLDREVPRLLAAARALADVDARNRVRERTTQIDRFLLGRKTGFLAFLVVMGVMFLALFMWADPVIDAIDKGFKGLGGLLRDLLGAGLLTDFLVDGVIGGVGSVLVFLPQILLLFLFLGFLEDCGYLARVAYLMDRVMRSMNLHGRAFVPMLSGFACAVPAIMATRTQERRRDRILTMMVVPLMTCSARLPVYTLLIGALIPGSRATQAMLMVAMYLFSTLTALVAAWVMSRSVKPLRAKRLPFFIELPPYRWPRMRDVLRMMWSKSSMFLREAGTVILACSIALWALLNFPRELPAGSKDYAALIAKADGPDKATLEAEHAAKKLEYSYGGRLGHAIEPLIRPLGFDWKIGVGIVGAFAAREVFVSTLGIVYAESDADENSESLREKLRGARTADGKRAYSPLVALSLMVFFALAMQCMSTLAIVRRETGSWRWPAFLFTYMTTLAYLASLAVFQIGTLLGFG
ncbi:MAG: ferrous iron transport protein B [Proteobacteria bacterium]|nr:ferrous iron transport protein B [Pseudomonadota bacterium]